MRLFFRNLCIEGILLGNLVGILGIFGLLLIGGILLFLLLFGGLFFGGFGINGFLLFFWFWGFVLGGFMFIGFFLEGLFVGVGGVNFCMFVGGVVFGFFICGFGFFFGNFFGLRFSCMVFSFVIGIFMVIWKGFVLVLVVV